MQTIKANPMPAALVGLGVGWMLLNRRSSDSHLTRTAYRYRYGGTPYRRAGYVGYGEDVYDPPASLSESNGGSVAGAVGTVQDSATRVTDQAQQTASKAVQQVQGTAGDMMEQVHDASGQVVERVQEQASRAQGLLQRQLDENPLLGSVPPATNWSAPPEN